MCENKLTIQGGAGGLLGGGLDGGIQGVQTGGIRGVQLGQDIQNRGQLVPV